MRRVVVSVAVIVTVAFGASTASAIDADVQCELKKLDTAAMYGMCRYRVESRHLRRGKPLDFTECNDKFNKNWHKAERRWGQDCPTSTDRATIQSMIAQHTNSIVAALSGVTTTTTTTTTTLGGGCPTKLQLEANGDGSDFDMGWMGLAHDQHFPSNLLLTVGVSSCQGSCGQCDVSGPIAGVSGLNNQRCTGDTSVECTADSDCIAAGGTCKFALGQSMAMWGGGVGVCLQGYVNDAVSGTVNLDLGTAEIGIAPSWDMFLGFDVAQPCPTCEGDPKPEDGVREGTCNYPSFPPDPHDGDPCDAGGTHLFSTVGLTSLDCPPRAIAQIGIMTTTPLTLSTRTRAVTLSAASPDCTSARSRFGGFKCFCDTCATANAEPCFSDADCPGGTTCGGRRCIDGVDLGTPCTAASDCTSNLCRRPGQATEVNSCAGGASDCLPDALDTDSGDEGRCQSGPLDERCNIESFRGCVVNSDCPAPGDTCASGGNRECFTDNGVIGGDVEVAGAPDAPSAGIWNPTLGALFCISPTNSSSVNTVLGLPGLGRITLPVTVTELP